MTRRFTIAANQGAIGGGEVMLFAIAEAARELGRRVTIVAPSHPSEVVVEAQRRGFATVAIDSDRGTAQYLANLRRWDARHRRGLLWCNGLRPGFATAGHRQRVVELHQRPEGTLRAVAAVATRGARVIVPSASMQSAVPQAEVLWNWSPPLPAAARRPEGQPITLGFLGRFSSDKGVVVLCAAMAELQRRQPGRFRLVLAGESRFVDPDDAATVQAAISALGEAVEVRGWLDREQFFAEVDLAVFPSVWAEPFGLVVTEAMAAQVPFVISDAGALPEVAGDAWLARANDSRALADRIEQASDDLQRYVASGRERWQQHFSPRAGRQRLSALLERLDPSPTTPVALAHDYFTQRGGAERVAVELTRVFPQAELWTALYEPATTFPDLAQVRLHTSYLNKLGALRRNFRLGLPLFGWAFTRSAATDAEVMIASSTAFAHGISTPASTVVYCHSPARFIYLIDEYLGRRWYRSPLGWGLMACRPFLRAWDQRAAQQADVYLCNSTLVRDRIRQVYGIEAMVVPPPAGLDAAGPQADLPELAGWSDHHLLVSRLLPYKNVDIAIEAFRDLPDERLLIVGKGPLSDQLRAMLPANVRLAEGLSDEQLRRAYATARAVIAPSHEDFGLTPVEGFGFGVPTIALRAGGYLDTVVEHVSGVFFDRPEPALLRAAVQALAERPLPRAGIIAHADQFSPERFARTLRAIVRGDHVAANDQESR